MNTTDGGHAAFWLGDARAHVTRGSVAGARSRGTTGNSLTNSMTLKKKKKLCIKELCVYSELWKVFLEKDVRGKSIPRSLFSLARKSWVSHWPILIPFHFIYKCVFLFQACFALQRLRIKTASKVTTEILAQFWLTLATLRLLVFGICPTSSPQQHQKPHSYHVFVHGQRAFLTDTKSFSHLTTHRRNLHEEVSNARQAGMRNPSAFIFVVNGVKSEVCSLW